MIRCNHERSGQSQQKNDENFLLHHRKLTKSLPGLSSKKINSLCFWLVQFSSPPEEIFLNFSQTENRDNFTKYLEGLTLHRFFKMF